jgi:hypothetical protein
MSGNTRAQKENRKYPRGKPHGQKRSSCGFCPEAKNPDLKVVNCKELMPSGLDEN